MSSGRGLRNEAPILLPATLLLFAMLASVTLLSYRTAVARFAAEREAATLKLAGALSDALRVSKSDDLAVLARWLPPGAALATYDARGGVRGSFGFADAGAFAAPVPRAAELAFPRVEGLGAESLHSPEPAQVIRAFVPFERAGQRFVLRLEVPEPALLAQQRSLRILTPVVFGLSSAVALLAIFFLRALVRPYEELLERARSAAPPGAKAAGGATRGSGDDVEALLATFDRALVALRDAPQDELSAVERTLGPQLESGLLMFDREGRVMAANPAAIELLGGAPRAAGEAGAAAAAIALAAHPAFAGAVSAATADGRSIARASVAIERSGRRVELGWTLQALRPAGGKRAGGEREEAGGSAGFLVLFADVTDLTRRETEERFAAGLAQLGELSAGVAHELRNSLATVQGYLALAARRELPEEAREEIAEARREASELERIVNDFLTFARPGSGAVEPVDLAALLLRATHDPALGGVPFELVPSSSPLPPIAGDPHLLQRALRNLLLNAAQATLARLAAEAPAGAVPEAVVVRLGRDDDQATITIDDRGSGISPAIRDRLFQPFASGRAGGAGLGLALARRIVLMHGGRLELLPRAPHGTRAEIRLPLGEVVTLRNG